MRREPADPLADSLTTDLRRDSAGSRRRQCGDSILPGLELFSRVRSSGESDGQGGRTIKRGARRCNERRVLREAVFSTHESARAYTQQLDTRLLGIKHRLSKLTTLGFHEGIFRIVDMNFRLV